MPATQDPTVVLPQLNGPPSPPPSSSRRRIPWIIAGAALILVIGAVLAVVLINQSKPKPQLTAVSNTIVFQSKLGSALNPVVAGNVAVSKSLQAVDGSQGSLRAAKNATQTVQQATIAARGAVVILTVPISQQALSQQAQQALTQETGYLQAVSSTLNDPTGAAASSLQPLASATSAAFVPLADVASGGASSIYGIDNLQGWVSGVKAASNRHKTPAVVVTPGPTTTVITPTPAPVPAPASTSGSGGLTACDQNISANANTSCGLAENVFVSYWQSSTSEFGWGDATVTAQSPSTNGFYSFACTTDGSTVNCLATGRTGDSLLVTFPMQAVVVY